MIKRTITYVDFNGTTRTETFCFHLSQAETIEFECSESGGITKLIEKIIATQETEAYSILFMELATDDKKAAEFIKGIIPEIKVDTPAASTAAPAIEMTSATK